MPANWAGISRTGATHPGLRSGAAHEVSELEGEHAGEQVHADGVAGPVAHRGERHHVAVFELTEGELGVGLGTVAGHDLGDGPVRAVGDQHPFAEDLGFQRSGRA